MIAIGPPPPIDLGEYISFDPRDGSFIRVKHQMKSLVGQRADYPTGDGCYRRVQFRARTYLAHRLAWFMQFGEWPDCLIDHKNQDGHDNRISNLRKASMSENQANRRPTGRYAKGVCLLKDSGKFFASIKKDNQTRYLGQFDTEAEAREAYAAAARETHGEFARY